MELNKQMEYSFFLLAKLILWSFTFVHVVRLQLACCVERVWIKYKCTHTHACTHTFPCTAFSVWRAWVYKMACPFRFQWCTLICFLRHIQPWNVASEWCRAAVCGSRWCSRVILEKKKSVLLFHLEDKLYTNQPLWVGPCIWLASFPGDKMGSGGANAPYIQMEITTALPMKACQCVLLM